MRLCETNCPQGRETRTHFSMLRQSRTDSTTSPTRGARQIWVSLGRLARKCSPQTRLAKGLPESPCGPESAKSKWKLLEGFGLDVASTPRRATADLVGSGFYTKSFVVEITPRRSFRRRNTHQWKHVGVRRGFRFRIRKLWDSAPQAPRSKETGAPQARGTSAPIWAFPDFGFGE